MKKLILIILLFSSLFLPVLAQQNIINQIENKLTGYGKKNLIEKLYMHTDREAYLAGETLWFKLYLVDGFDHLPLDLSQVAYIELLDQENQAILQVKTSLQKGTGNGSIFIPVTINSGNYLLRAYTSWMQNSDPEFFFQKELSIINTFKTLGPTLAAEKSTATLELYPEGGYMVAGLPANLVVKSVTGQSARGRLIKNHEDTIHTFVLNDLGMAKIEVNPESGSQYEVILTNEEGGKIAGQQLKVEAQGYTMQLEERQDVVNINIHSNLNVPLANLVIHNRGKITKAHTLHLQNGKASVEIAKAALGENVSHITLFDLTGKPVAERLFFRPGVKDLQISVSGNEDNYATRQKVSLQVKTKNENDAPLAANLSMSVKQLFAFEKEKYIDISQFIHLTSDIPAINFEISNIEAASLDLIMLTAGWRRFTWDDVLTEIEDTIHFHPEMNGHIIKGMIKTRQDLTPAPYVKGYLSIPGKKAQIFGGLSNSEGEIYFETRDFYKKNQIIVQSENDSLYQISIENPFSEKFTSTSTTDLLLTEADAAELNQRSINLQVQNTYYGSAYRQSILPDLDSTAFFGVPDATYYLDDYTRFPTMEDVMREYVANVWVRKNRNGYYFLVYDMANKDVFKNSSMVLLDGVPIFDTDKIIAYDPLNVEKIDLVKRKFLHGLLTCEGIVSYTTYEGNLKDFPLDPRILIIDYEGLQGRREFYAPEYGQQKNSSMPDFRTLLHWQPQITTENGNAEISFYTSDQPGTYLIDVQGMSGNGRFGSFQKVIKVDDNPVN